MWIQSLGWEDPLEVDLVTHSSILASRIPCREEPGGLQSIVLQRVGHNWSSLACMHAPYHNHTFIILKSKYFNKLNTIKPNNENLE